MIQSFNNEVKKELDRLLQASQETHTPQLAEDEVTAVKRNLQTLNIEASPQEVRFSSCFENNVFRKIRFLMTYSRHTTPLKHCNVRTFYWR